MIVGGESWRLGGDIIVASEGRTGHDAGAAALDHRAQAPGDEIEVEVYRADRRLTVTVKLGRAPSAA